MKQKLFTLTLLLFTFFICSTKTFEQADSGGLDTGGGTGTSPDGGSTGGVTPPPPPPPMIYTFKRNNGNGFGVCGGDAQIRVAFETIPADNQIPLITKILYNDGKSATPVEITSVRLPIAGTRVDKTQPYVSYCIEGIVPSPGNSQGNINPAVKLTLIFSVPTIVTANGTHNGIELL